MNEVIDRQQAMGLLQQGRFEEANSALRGICEREPGDAQAWFNLALSHVELADPAAAVDCFQRAEALEPKRAVIPYNLARALHMAGRLDEAVDGYQRAIALSPDMAAAYCNLANVLMDQGRYEDAIQRCQAALQRQPGLAEAHYNLCEAYKRLKRLDEAHDAYLGLIHSNPDFAEAHGGLGSVLLSKGDIEQALNSFKKSLELRPDLVPSHYGMALCYKDCGLDFKAEACFREALRHDPKHVPSYMGLARLLTEGGLYQEAYQVYHHVLELNPEHATAGAELAVTLDRMGRFDEAWQQVQALLAHPRESIDFATATAFAFSLVSRRVGRSDDALAMVTDALARGEREYMEDDQGVLLHFAAGHLLDSNGDYDRAFEHFEKGNDINWALGQRISRQCYDHQAVVERNGRVIETFSADFMRRAPRATHGSQRPVFIVGMPRSGTSLTEQILASHPAVFGAGELEHLGWMATVASELLGSDLPYPECFTAASVQQFDELARQYLDALEALGPGSVLRITDKMPDNFNFLGLIELLFPQARIIHCTRDPADTCLSCYSQAFIRSHNYQYTSNLEALGRYYSEYRRLMAHWKSVLRIPILDVSYEETVADYEGTARRVLAFCDLPWDEACLRFYENKRMVNTASYDQVRRPIYDKSVGRWRNYEKHLQPLLKNLPRA